MNARQLNGFLTGKKIVRVEAGTSPGWIVLVFDPEEVGDWKPEAPADRRVYMTVWVGGQKLACSESEHYATCALHFKVREDGEPKDAYGGIVYQVRCEQDPEQYSAGPEAWEPEP